MSTVLECDRCGFQEQTGSVMLFAGLTGPGIPTARPELPDGWTRPLLPTEDGELRHRDLCTGCKTDLFGFMRGVAVPGRKPDVALVAEAQQSAVCRGCGHLTHGGKRCRARTMSGPSGELDECGCGGGTATDG